MSFFDEYYTLEGSTMLYAQKRTVVNKPNPPSGPWSAQNNRPEGYANYLIGKFYLACEPNVITVNRFSTKKKRRGKTKDGKEEDGHLEALEGLEAEIPEEELQSEDVQGCEQEGHWIADWPPEGSWVQDSPWPQSAQAGWTHETWKEGLQEAWTDGDWWSAWPMAGETFPEAEQAEQADCAQYGPQFGYYGQAGQAYAESDWQETYAGSSCVSDGESSEKMGVPMCKALTNPAIQDVSSFSNYIKV